MCQNILCVFAPIHKKRSGKIKAPTSDIATAF